MYLMATGEPPFRDRAFDGDLLCDIVGGLRPLMPDSTPEEYKKLAQHCCDADPVKRPNAELLKIYTHNLIAKGEEDASCNNIWNAIYNNNVRPLSRE